MAPSSNLVATLLLCISWRSVVGSPLNNGNGPSNNGTGLAGFSEMAAAAASVSPSCLLAMASLQKDEFKTCADLSGLFSIIDHQEESIVPRINKWVSGVCTTAPCSESSLASASQLIRTGCADDLQKQSILAVATYSVLTHYTATRNVFCTQYKSNSTFCLPTILGNVEAASQERMDLGEVISLMKGKITRADQAFLAVSTGNYCNDCGHAIVTQSAAMINAIRQDPVGIKFEYNPSGPVHTIAAVCGASFEDGKVPETVQVAPAQSANPPPKN